MHLNMVIYNMGISSILIASNFSLSLEELDRQLIETYQTFLEQAQREEKKS